MQISISHIYAYIRKDVIDQFLPTFKVLGVIMLIFSIVNLSTIYFGSGMDQNFVQNMIGVYLIGSLVYGVNLFYEVGKVDTRTMYLSLPMSTLDKVIAKFIMMAVLFQVGMFILYVFFYYFIYFIGMTLGIEFSATLFPDFVDVSLFFHLSLVLGSIFGFGSIKFNNFSFPKIVIWVIAFVLSFAVVMIVVALALFPELREFLLDAFLGNDEIQSLQLLDDSASLEESWALQVLKSAWYFFLIPAFWVMIFLHLRDKEVS